MAAQKITTRQKMIQMMYLVMTALLALNVSKEVLDAFSIVNESIIKTQDIFSQKIDDSYKEFERNYQLNQTEVLPFWTKGLEAQKYSRELINYIENLKTELIAFSEFIEVDSARNLPYENIKNLDDFTRTTNFMMGPSETGRDGKAGELKEKILEYRAAIILLLDTKDQDSFKLGLNVEEEFKSPDGGTESWEFHFFYDTILAADIALLNKLIMEIYNIEFDIINYLMTSIGKGDFKYDMIAAKVLPKSNYIFEGESFEAEVIVAAYDTVQSPDVFILQGVDSLSPQNLDRATKISSIPGKISLELLNSRPGINKYAGLVQVQTNSGNINNFPFNGQYFVAKPIVTISAMKMNVFYAGVDNPVSISTSGILANDLVASISCGQINKIPNQDEWIVRVPLDCNITTLTVELITEGERKLMGQKAFRVKSIPKPTATIANKRDGYIDNELIIAAGAIVPKMPNDFDFEYPMQILSFQLRIQRGFNNYQFSSQNNRLTAEMIDEIQRTNRGQIIIFDQIKALGPDNEELELSPINLILN
ncbi:gliding motility protein GldM [Bacteroidota bacterium]